jgi:hypothetical protein
MAIELGRITLFGIMHTKLKALALSVAAFSSFTAGASAEKDSRTFLEFHPTAPPIVFRIEQAQALADAQFARIYGACGMTVFKGMKGRVWTFETRVGYGGTPGPDISVVEPSVLLPNFSRGKMEPNQPLLPTSGLRPAAADL